MTINIFNSLNDKVQLQFYSLISFEPLKDTLGYEKKLSQFLSELAESLKQTRRDSITPKDVLKDTELYTKYFDLLVQITKDSSLREVVKINSDNICQIIKRFSRIQNNPEFFKYILKSTLSIISRIYPYKRKEEIYTCILLFFRDLQLKVNPRKLNDFCITLYQFLIDNNASTKTLTFWWELLADIVFPLLIQFPFIPLSPPEVKMKITYSQLLEGWTEEGFNELIQNTTNFILSILRQNPENKEIFIKSTNTTFSLIEICRSIPRQDLEAIFNILFEHQSTSSISIDFIGNCRVYSSKIIVCIHDYYFDYFEVLYQLLYILSDEYTQMEWIYIMREFWDFAMGMDMNTDQIFRLTQFILGQSKKDIRYSIALCFLMDTRCMDEDCFSLVKECPQHILDYFSTYIAIAFSDKINDYKKEKLKPKPSEPQQKNSLIQDFLADSKKFHDHMYSYKADEFPFKLRCERHTRNSLFVMLGVFKDTFGFKATFKFLNANYRMNRILDSYVKLDEHRLIELFGSNDKELDFEGALVYIASLSVSDGEFVTDKDIELLSGYIDKFIETGDKKLLLDGLGSCIHLLERFDPKYFKLFAQTSNQIDSQNLTTNIVLLYISVISEIISNPRLSDCEEDGLLLVQNLNQMCQASNSDLLFEMQILLYTILKSVPNSNFQGLASDELLIKEYSNNSQQSLFFPFVSPSSTGFLDFGNETHFEAQLNNFYAQKINQKTPYDLYICGKSIMDSFVQRNDTYNNVILNEKYFIHFINVFNDCLSVLAKNWVGFALFNFRCFEQTQQAHPLDYKMDKVKSKYLLINKGNASDFMQEFDLSDCNILDDELLIDPIVPSHRETILDPFAYFLEQASTPDTTLIDYGEDKECFLARLFQSESEIKSKIGVLYVNESQTEQSGILHNTIDDTTPIFQSFLASLGQRIKLRNHLKYNGKLDIKNDIDGKESVFFDDLYNEVMFHVAPLMPSNLDDPQELRKKRHIGNDHIHIVWSDNQRRYDRNTILSQFNTGHVVVSPTKNGLYRVYILKKNEEVRFPVVPGEVILPWEALSFVVKWAAILMDHLVTKQEIDVNALHELFVAQVREFHRPREGRVTT